MHSVAWSCLPKWAYTRNIASLQERHRCEEGHVLWKPSYVQKQNPPQHTYYLYPDTEIHKRRHCRAERSWVRGRRSGGRGVCPWESTRSIYQDRHPMKNSIKKQLRLGRGGASNQGVSHGLAPDIHTSLYTTSRHLPHCATCTIFSHEDSSECRINSIIWCVTTAIMQSFINNRWSKFKKQNKTKQTRFA